MVINENMFGSKIFSKTVLTKGSTLTDGIINLANALIKNNNPRRLEKSMESSDKKLHAKRLQKIRKIATSATGKSFVLRSSKK
jgi:hypothetical protein